MTPVIFWGATGQAKVLREALQPQGIELIAIFDNREIPSPFTEVPIFHGETGFMAWLSQRGSAEQAFSCVAIGGVHGQDRLERMLWLQNNGFPPLTVIHPSAFIATDAHVGDGCQILAMSAICSTAKLGRSVIVNTKASIDHDCIIADGVHIGPGATLAGEVVVESCAFIGAGAIILPRIHIGANAVVGAGAVVTKDIAAFATVTGIPARTHNKAES